MARQLDAEIRNPTDRMAEIEREGLGDQLLAQREVLDLEGYALRRWLFDPPGSYVVRLAANGRYEETIPGDERDPWGGAVILNPSGAAVGVGFAAGGATGAPLFVVPAGSYLAVPVRFVNISIGLVDQATDLAGPEARIVVSRLRIPPMGIQAGPIASTDLGGIADTVSAAGSTAAAPAANTVIAQVPNLVPGVYRVTTVTYESAAPDANPANIQLLAGGQIKGAALPSTATPLSTPFPRVTVPAGASTIVLRTGGAVGGAGSVYTGVISATRLA
jgi:hypothetical protein